MTKLKQPKILVLGDRNDSQSPLLDSLGQSCLLQFAQTIEQVLECVKHDHFDAVVSDTASFLPLQHAIGSEQAAAILNTIGEGVGIVAAEGAFLWANEQLERFGEPVKQEVAQRSLQAYQAFAQANHQSHNNARRSPSRKYAFMITESDRHFEMICNPMRDHAGAITSVATVIWEDTANRRLQQRIDVIDQAGRELVRFDAETIASMTVEQRIRLIQDKIIRYGQQLLHFDHFLVRLLNRQSHQLEVLFGYNIPAAEPAELFVNSQNNGISGYVAATGRSYICNDPSNDPHYLPGLDKARSSLTVPLRLHDKVIGILNVESHHHNAFNEDDRQVAEIFGRHIAIALNILDLLVVERYQTTGQAAENLCRQLSGPLSKIMTQVSLLMEDYIGHDDLRKRLQGLIDNATEIRQALKDVQAGPRGIFAVRTTYEQHPELADKHFLVVDDEPLICQTIADVVRRCQCTVDTAADGREALALIAQQQYDLVISDIKLPHANGYHVFAAASARNIPVLLMTGFGYDPNHSIVRANRQGLSGVLYKPFKADQLLTKIAQAVSSQ